MNLPLVIAACACAGLLLILVVVWRVYALWLRHGGAFSAQPASRLADLTNEHGEIDPAKQIKHLKRSTAEFGIRYDELKFGKMLGKGSQGEVFKANWRGSTVAVKKVDTRKVPPEIIEEFCQEAQIMRRLRHPTLTLFMGVSLEHPHLCIVTEIVARGSLFDIIHDEHAALTWPKCLGIALDVAKGLTYLHAHNPPILHRDLKSLNILVDENWRGKVADFGMTRFQEDGTMTQCVSIDTKVPLPNGKMIRADEVRVGMELIGQDGARVTVQRSNTGSTALMYRVAHEDRSSYTVTENHLVTLRWCAGPRTEFTRSTDSDGQRQRSIDLVWWEFEHGRPVKCSLGKRQCAVASEKAADDQLRVQMWDAFYQSGRDARALRVGDLIEIRADVLSEKEVWDIISGGKQRKYRATGRRTTIDAAQDEADDEEEQQAKLDALNTSLAAVTQARPSCTLSAKEDGSWQPTVAGDSARVVIHLRQSHAFRNLDRALKSVGVRTGVIATALSPLSADDEANELSDLVCQTSMQTVLNGLGSGTIVACGADVQARWMSADRLVPGVSELMTTSTPDGQRFTTFLYSATTAAAPHRITVWHSPDPSSDVRRHDVTVALRAALGVAGASDDRAASFHSRGMRLESIEPIRQCGQKFQAITVDGNQRFAIEQGILTHNCGSPLWMSPEMIRNDPYDTPSDVFSFAVCLWEMYTRKIPYRDLGLNPSQLVVKVVKEGLRPPIPKQCPKPFRQLMERCWHHNAEKRPTFPQILATLEQLVADPAILNHKPMSSRDSTVIVRPTEEGGGGGGVPGLTNPHAPLGASLGLVTAERGWKIDAKELRFYNADSPAFLELDQANLPLGAVGAPSPAPRSTGGRTASKSTLGESKDAGGANGVKLHLLTDAETLEAAGRVVGPSSASTLAVSDVETPTSKSAKKKASSSADKKAAATSAAGSSKKASVSALGRSQLAAAAATPASPSLAGSSGIPAPLALNKDVVATKDAEKDEVSLASQGPGVLLAKFRNKLVAVKACFLDSSFLQMTNEERVLADLDGKGARDSKLATFMRSKVAGLRHPNIVLFQGAYLEPIDALRMKLKESGQLAGSGLDDAPAPASALGAPNTFVGRPPAGCEYYLGVVSEFMPRGTLHNILVDPSLVVDWATMIQLLLDAAAGMTYLHASGPIVHQDFHSRRLLVDRNWRVRIGDYAFVDLQAALAGKALPATTWSPPEYIKNPSLSTLTPAANAYSFGMLIWQAVTRKPVWEDRVLDKALADKIVKQGDRPALPASLASRDLKNLIEKCWMADPHARPTFQQILDELVRLQKQGPPKITLAVGVNGAHMYRKARTVFAYRSKDPVTILKDWGTNLGKKNCVVLFSGEDDVYLCDEDVFKATYEPVEGGEDESHQLEGWPPAIAAAAAAAGGTGDTPGGPASPSGAGGAGVSAFSASASAASGSSAGGGSVSPSGSTAPPVDFLSRRHEWRKTGTVLARCMEEAFSVQTAGGSEHGMAGDYLVQNEQGDQWSVEARTFLELYERMK